MMGMHYGRIRPVIALFCVMSLACGCGEVNAGADEPKEPAVFEEISEGDTAEDAMQSYEKTVIPEMNITDNNDLYADEDPLSVTDMYLTVGKGNDADSSSHTWKEVNTFSAYDYAEKGIDRYKVEGILQIDEDGGGIDEGSFGYGETTPNVTVQIRGQTSTLVPEQKNYKIRIKDGKGSFKGQQTLNLNKHVMDPYRFLNKLNYDLLNSIPQLMGARTRFVHLYVRDDTNGAESEFADYGLYTMVEQMNRTYLRDHGLDDKGQLYKVTFFEWQEYDEVMTPEDDPGFNTTAFEEYMEIKGDRDVSKLQEVIRKVNNYSIPIEETIEQHFNAENLSYWMAFNILNGNNDVASRNLFIYSPLNSEKFYMICWDMDDSFKYSYNTWKQYHDGSSWEVGMSKFLSLVLAERMMKEEKYRKMLDSAVEDIYRNYVNPETVKKKADAYSRIVEEYSFQMPDLDGLFIQSKEVYKELVSEMPAEVDRNYQVYKETMKRPFPFYIGEPALSDGGKSLSLSWDTAYDYGGEEVTYDYVIATDYEFNNVVTGEQGLVLPMATTDMLPPGEYFLKVVARNESGYATDCFDYCPVDEYGKAYGCYRFIIDPDGSITANLDEEIPYAGGE